MSNEKRPPPICKEILKSIIIEGPMPMKVGSSAYDKFFKTVIIGSSSVGKTSLCAALDGKAGEGAVATIGVDHLAKSYLADNETVILQIWDTAGMEKYATVIRSTFHSARAVVLVYAVDDRKSFDDVSSRWRRVMDELLPESRRTPVFLVANKTDLPNEEWHVTKWEALELCEPLGWSHFEACALHQGRTDALFVEIVRLLVYYDRYNRSESNGRKNTVATARTDSFKLDGTREIGIKANAVAHSSTTGITVHVRQDSSPQQTNCYC